MTGEVSPCGYWASPATKFSRLHYPEAGGTTPSHPFGQLRDRHPEQTQAHRAVVVSSCSPRVGLKVDGPPLCGQGDSGPRMQPRGLLEPRQAPLLGVCPLQVACVRSSAARGSR